MNSHRRVCPDCRHRYGWWRWSCHRHGIYSVALVKEKTWDLWLRADVAFEEAVLAWEEALPDVP